MALSSFLKVHIQDILLYHQHKEGITVISLPYKEKFAVKLMHLWIFGMEENLFHFSLKETPQ